ncbi:MAG TPA: hypothetical protein VET26_02065, partial [Candidatus Sulfotelmatobacter sp.]|nr:hypothetical protein [Candidatus Sulfotelmatobacter sp.]
ITVLPAKHPGAMGGEVAYKGAVDDAVPVGETELRANPGDMLVPEAEWCVLLVAGTQRFLERPESLTADEPIVLQGMIEGKWLNRLLGPLEWKPASIGNNLLAAGPGIATTLGGIEEGVDGEILVRYRARGGDRMQSSTIADLRGHNIHGLVQAALRHCRDTRLTVDAVNCSARGAKAALADDPEFLRRALITAGVSPSDLREPQAWQRVIAVAVEMVRADGLAIEPGTPVELSVRSQGTTVGTGRLTILA